MNTSFRTLLLLVTMATTGCATTISKQEAKPLFAKTVELKPLSKPGKFCMLGTEGDLGGIATTTTDVQHGIGDCARADWQKDDVLVLYFGDPKQQAKDDEAEENLDFYLHPENYSTGSETTPAAATDCSGVDCIQQPKPIQFDPVIVHFHSDEDKPFDKAEIDLVISAARQAASEHKSVIVTGHTDSTGSAKHNASLSDRRANAIKAILAGEGLNMDMVSTKSRGAESPVATNETNEGRAENRRATIEENEHGN